jgi:hypothetical protein
VSVVASMSMALLRLEYELHSTPPGDRGGTGPLTDELIDAVVAVGVAESNELDWKSELLPARGCRRPAFPRTLLRWQTAVAA